VRRLVAAAVALALTGCFRTVYRNVEPFDAPAPGVQMVPRSPEWRSFFLYGWLPHEVAVDAAAECGGASRVRELRTRQTFTQALVGTFASSGVNVYSPWTGEVVCAPP
jgi:Bor protein